MPHGFVRALTFATILPLGWLPDGKSQVTTLDSGSFTVTRNGNPAGREEFSIRSTPGIGGNLLKAQATISSDGRRLTPALSTDQAGAPVSYQLEVRAAGEVSERLSGQMNRGRISMHAQSAAGSSAREYVVTDGALILDDDVYHQYFFLSLRGIGSGNVPVVVPRRSTQMMMRVASRGAERVTVGGREVTATRLDLTEPGGAERQIWVDAQHRVLRVAVPAQGIVATRDEVPR